MARYRIFYWKHIPSSITVEGDGRTVKKQLSQKIQNAIDAYAMAEGINLHRQTMPPSTNAAIGSNVKAPLKRWQRALVSELETEFAKIDIPRRNGR